MDETVHWGDTEQGGPWMGGSRICPGDRPQPGLTPVADNARGRGGATPGGGAPTPPGTLAAQGASVAVGVCSLSRLRRGLLPRGRGCELGRLGSHPPEEHEGCPGPEV